MLMLIVKMMTIVMMIMLVLVLMPNTVSKENDEKVHPKQSALATAHHGRQAVQHYPICAGCAALAVLGSSTCQGTRQAH